MRLVRTYIMVRWIRFPYELKFSLSPLFYISISFKLYRFGRYCFNGGLICPSFLPFLPFFLFMSLLLCLTSSYNFSPCHAISLCLIPSLNFSLYLYLSLSISLTVPLRLSNSLSYTSSFSLDLPSIDRYRW